MKNQVLIFLLLFAVNVSAQHKNVFSNYGAEIPQVEFHPVLLEKSECIPEGAREEALRAIAANKREILKSNPDAFSTTVNQPLFLLPIRAKAGFNDYGYYTLNNQVDHNFVPNNNLEDYNCGKRTYDWVSGNHGGTDYILWPYPWMRMDEEIMEIVAAAEGIIIDKRDGNFDRMCSNSGNPNWNGIIIEHADGSQAWYWHFKDGAITSKGIGDSVAVGEYLGAAGSSGSSNWPHLHFEIFDFNGDRIDPYAGPCNEMNSESWWQNQPNYNIPTINRISTHYTADFYENCPNPEITYEELNFEPGELMSLRLFYRDIQEGADTDITIYAPNGTVFMSYTWTANWGQDYATAWAQWLFDIDNNWPDGIYNVEVVFGGNTYETVFGVNTNLGVEDLEANEIAMYPNPTSNIIVIESSTPIDKVTIFDVLGRKVLNSAPMDEKTTLNMSGLNAGIYMAVITSEGKRTVKKILKH